MSAWKPSVFGPVDGFQQLDHVPRAVHAAPADFALGRQPLAEFLGDVAGLAKRVGDPLRAGLRVRRPLGRRAGRVDPHDAVRPDAELLQRAGDAAAFADLREELLAGRVVAHRRAAAGGRPHGRDDRADHQPVRANLFRQLFQLLVGRIDADVRIEQKQIDAVEPLAVDLGRGRQIEHRIELDRRLAALAFADDAGPRGVVKFGKVV